MCVKKLSILLDWPNKYFSKEVLLFYSVYILFEFLPSLKEKRRREKDIPHTLWTIGLNAEGCGASAVPKGPYRPKETISKKAKGLQKHQVKTLVIVTCDGTM